ncbi:hypothetical protein [Nocardioides humi]|uniref:Aminoglycoside phosphotransferase domain-containing protein n=1 Tax=Nocardioides humi TaxID=449461 RepID=A0ABN1ZYA0_9ACTN|nr:hypothetical protein [Nocardioides humi]
MTRTTAGFVDPESGPGLTADDAVGVMDELAALIGDALGRPVRLVLGSAAPPADGPVFHAYDGSGAVVAVARWALDPVSAQLLLAEAAVLAAVGEVAELGSPLVAPRLVALTTWHGGPLLVEEAGPPPYASRPPTREERRAAELAVARLVTPADLDRSYAAELRTALARLEPSSVTERLAATFELLAERHDLDALPRGAWHGNWSPTTIAAAAAGGGRVLAWGWERFAVNRPLGFDTLHFRLAQLRLRGRSAGVGAVLVREAAELLTEWPVRPEDRECVARLLLLELAVRELREVGERQAPVSWAADWLAPTLFSV